MSILRSVFICCLISLLAGGGLFFLGSVAGYEQFKGGYAVLSFDSSENDREIRHLLDSGRYLFGGTPISLSSQWVYLDIFGSIAQIPLDEYENRVLPFDPRNDGYAGKLKEFFVRDGKQYFYVPLIAGNWNESFLNKQFGKLLHDIPFSADYYGIGKPLSMYFFAYGAASFMLIMLYFIRRNMRLWIVNILTLIPLFSSFAFFGAEGIAAAAILFGAFFLLREPLYELASSIGSSRTSFLRSFALQTAGPYKSYWKSLIFFVIALCLLIFFTGLKPMFVIVIFIVSLAVFIISSRILSRDTGNRKRFSPVAIKKKPRPEFAFFVYMIPFVSASLLVLFFTPFTNGVRQVDGKYSALINEKDYYEHLEHQASFSVTKLGIKKGSGYYDYQSGEDGLPAVSAIQKDHNINFNDYPAFPLKHLIDFLNNDYND